MTELYLVHCRATLFLPLRTFSFLLFLWGVCSLSKHIYSISLWSCVTVFIVVLPDLAWLRRQAVLVLFWASFPCLWIHSTVIPSCPQWQEATLAPCGKTAYILPLGAEVASLTLLIARACIDLLVSIVILHPTFFSYRDISCCPHDAYRWA